jgi:hypothetical protein
MLAGWGRAERDVDGMLRWGIASMSVGSAVIHASVVPDHAGLPLHVAFFLVTAAVQSGPAAVVLRSRSGRWLALTAACNGVIAVIWVLSRTTGLAVDGAAAAETIGFKDAISTLLEIGVVAGAGLVAILPEASRRVPLRVDSLAPTVMAVIVWVMAVAGVAARHTHDDPTHLHGRGAEGLAAAHREHRDAHEPEAAVTPVDPDHQEHAHITYMGDRSVRGGGNHRHDDGSEAVADDGPEPPRGEGQHAHRHALALADTDPDGHEHRPASDSHDHGTGGGHDPDDAGRGPVTRLIDDVIGLLGSSRPHHTPLEVSP